MQSLLKDLILAGVKWELSDDSIGFNEMISHPAPTPERTRTVASVVPPISPVVPMSVDTAVAMATRPTTIDSLLRMILEFNHPLRTGVSNVVLPHAATNPNGVMIITDIPSSDDDACGQILSGGTGELLDKMMGAIGMSRETVSISPLLFWRTPGGRTPSRTELDLSRPFVNRFIELTEPRIIITLGTIAASEFAGIDLIHNHGAETILPNNIHVFSIYHPNYIILKPDTKRDVWAVLQNVQKLLKNL
ncbi:MAG: uracil-DNA glycosylase [Alphaproteobacteria bacterium]|nr:uracil-DNA glycosylase [Alphaproteobacteria bacterium]